MQAILLQVRDRYSAQVQTLLDADRPRLLDLFLPPFPQEPCILTPVDISNGARKGAVSRLNLLPKACLDQYLRL
jgi:hypothetical protein